MSKASASELDPEAVHVLNLLSGFPYTNRYVCPLYLPFVG